MPARLHNQGDTVSDTADRSAAARAGDFIVESGLRCVVAADPVVTQPASRVPLGGRFPGDPTASGATTVLELLTWLAFTTDVDEDADPALRRLLRHYAEPIRWLRDARAGRTPNGPERLGGLLADDEAGPSADEAGGGE